MTGGAAASWGETDRGRFQSHDGAVLKYSPGGAGEGTLHNGRVTGPPGCRADAVYRLIRQSNAGRSHADRVSRTAPEGMYRLSRPHVTTAWAGATSAAPIFPLPEHRCDIYTGWLMLEG